MKFIIDQNALKYDGRIYSIDEDVIYYRKAKVTPKKVGEFVTFYDRTNNKNHPFSERDNFKYLVINSGGENNYFIFPREVLIKQNILTTSKLGKMAFRVYPPNCIPIVKQAIKSQSWQLEYYYLDINLNEMLESLIK